MTVVAQQPEGIIQPEIAYPVRTLDALGFGSWAVRKMRRDGHLVIRRVGRRSFVLGADLIRAIERHGKIVGPRGELK